VGNNFFGSLLGSGLQLRRRNDWIRCHLKNLRQSTLSEDQQEDNDNQTSYEMISRLRMFGNWQN
jgi:hypothetical protein